MVREYTDCQLMRRVKELKSYTHIPQGYWILGVQSQADLFDKFDDKFYLYKGEVFITMVTGTTNAGASSLKNYQEWNLSGAAVIKTDEWYYDLWSYGLHNGRMPALRQSNDILYYRDRNRNQKAEEGLSTLKKGMIGINFHTVTYNGNIPLIRRVIGGWSAGCQVVNNVEKYYEILELIKDQERVTYCLLKEFNV